LEFLSRLINRHSNFASFWKAWVRWLRKDIRSGRYRGCPFANFAGQLGQEMNQYQEPMDAIVSAWRERLADFLCSCDDSRKNLDSKQALELADSIMIQFEGAVALYNMTGDEHFIRKLERDVLQFVGLRLS
ncbi:MAG: TetR family transcriptional regulator C-terminal domain-containing protein, partial [Leptospiraceae bacterium]|nr:TetR family transcriptional regulator C-terminal domain-containing protein [Leptospiraceae bacterium]